MTRITDTLSRPPLSLAIWISCVAASSRLAPSICRVMPISSSSTMSLRPSEQKQIDISRQDVVVMDLGLDLGSTPSARVTRFLFCECRASSAVIMPASICSCNSEWSRVNFSKASPRRR